MSWASKLKIFPMDWNKLLKIKKAKQLRFCNLNEVWQIKFAYVISNNNIWVHFTNEVLQLEDKNKTLKSQWKNPNDYDRKKEKPLQIYSSIVTTHLKTLLSFIFSIYLHQSSQLACFQADADLIYPSSGLQEYSYIPNGV